MSDRWRTSKEGRHWIAQVKKRDKGCVITGEKRNCDVHHIKDASNHMDLRFNVDNGVTLARRYHRAYHTKFLRSYRCKCTVKTFIRFLKLVAIAKGIAMDTFTKRVLFTKNIVND